MSLESTVFRLARARITDPKRWCKVAWSRNAGGFSVPSGSPDAIAWCAEGAIHRECSDNILLVLRCHDAFRRFTPFRHSNGEPLELMCVNDSEFFGHDAVLHALDTVADKLEEIEAERIGSEILRAVTTESDYPERNVEVACAAA